MELPSNSIFNALKNINNLLDFDQKKRSVIMFLLLIVNAFLDVIGLASIFPLIELAIQPGKISANRYLYSLYNSLGGGTSMKFLFILSIFIFGIFLIKNLLTIVIYFIQTKFCFNVSLRLSQKLYQHYYEKGYAYISGRESGQKIYDIITVPNIFANNYLLETLLLFTEFLVLIIIFIVIFIINPSALIVLGLIISPTFLIIYQLIKNKTKNLGHQKNLIYPKIQSTIIDSLNAYTDTILTNKEKYFHDNLISKIKEVNKIDSIQVGIYSKIHQRLNDIILGLGLLIIFGCGYFLNIENTKLVSTLSVFGLASYRFLPSVNRIMGSILLLKNVSYIFDELNVIIGKSVKEFKNYEPIKFDKTLEFKNISFAYSDGDEILKKISFHINKGETIGLIGASGSGKTTLLKILLRLENETAGEIYIDGVQLNKEENGSFQNILGYVQQNVYIKNGTLKENIAFGEIDSEINLSKLKRAIKYAHLNDFDEGREHEDEILLGENGSKLSGGQKQRIGIARALYKDAEILIFDEATSALDYQAERAIVNAINELSQLNKTIIIVAHRLTTLEKCDRIYELKDGSIVGNYTYKQIMHRISNKS
jgi:ATP-binding cassette, subfamily B, bacterial PglK